jgi:hypothetical protein
MISIWSKAKDEKSHTESNECHQHETHQASLGIMHEISESQPFFCLSCNLALLAILVSFWEQIASVSEMIEEILDNKSAFGNDNRLIRARCSD